MKKQTMNPEVNKILNTVDTWRVVMEWLNEKDALNDKGMALYEGFCQADDVATKSTSQFTQNHITLTHRHEQQE